MTPGSDSAPDRFTLELIKGALNAARAEMEALVARTAMSPFIREKKDYFTAAFLNPKGELVVSTSLTLAGNLVDAILDEYPAQTMRAGDLYWYNDCYGTRGAGQPPAGHGVRDAGLPRGPADRLRRSVGATCGTSAARFRARSARSPPPSFRKAS